jgi:hypothetical protein
MSYLLLPPAGLLVIMEPAWADDRDASASNAGILLTGAVISGPRFVHGDDLRGVELPHTHLRLRGDDGKIYDIAIDDIFDNGYDQAGESAPAALSQIRPSDHLELYGKPYASGRPGMDWVLTSCSDPADAGQAGWLGESNRPGLHLGCFNGMQSKGYAS